MNNCIYLFVIWFHNYQIKIMLDIVKELFNYPRSVTGQATRDTLKYIERKVKNLKSLNLSVVLMFRLENSTNGT